MLCLLFSVGTNRLVLDCESIVEVIPRVNLKKIPSLPYYVAGLLDYGGIPVPVIDIARLLENRDSAQAMHTRVVLVKSPIFDLQYMGLICEKATTTIEIDQNKFKVPIIKTEALCFLEGVCTIEDETLQFLNVNELLKMIKDEINGALAKDLFINKKDELTMPN